MIMKNIVHSLTVGMVASVLALGLTGVARGQADKAISAPTSVDGKADHKLVLKGVLVYGALFMSSRKASHGKLLAYAQERMRVIAPLIKSYEGDAVIAQDFKRIAQENKPLIERLEKDFYDAIVSHNKEKFMTAFAEVSACDRQLGIKESTIPAL